MNSKYIIPLGCALGGGLIYRHYHNKYLNDIKDTKYYALITYQYDANIFNQGMLYGFSIGVLYVTFKNFNFPYFKISPNFS